MRLIFGSPRKAVGSKARQRNVNGMEAKIALLNAHFSFFARSLMATPCQPVKKVLTSWQTGEQALTPGSFC